MQLTRPASSSIGRARCHAQGGTTICGVWPAEMSGPTTCVVTASGLSPSPPISSSIGLPRWYNQISVPRTVCHADCCPGSSRNRIAVPAERAPPNMFGSATPGNSMSLRQVSQYQPPSG